MDVDGATKVKIWQDMYKQAAWERDVAIKQLEQLGYELGEKIEPDQFREATKKTEDGTDTNVGSTNFKLDDNGYVALSEKVTATFYDDEHEEWTQKTMTIADILDSFCDDYTVTPSVQPERKTGRWIQGTVGLMVTEYKCSECGRTVRDDTGYDVYKDYPYCHCGAEMRKDGEE